MLAVCLNNNQLKVEMMESAKYISSLIGKQLSDTLSISVKTTTVLNPFTEKSTFKIIKLNPTIRYIQIADKVVLVSNQPHCDSKGMSPL